MTRRIVIAGASGFIGSHAAARFREDGEEVVTIGRRTADAVWTDEAGVAGLVDGADLLLNLAGRSVDTRYGPANRAEILRSRVETTAALGRAVAAASQPPPVWLNASTATIYRHADDRPMTEADGEFGTGFSVDVATAWEREFFRAARDGVRQVALRTAITLGDGSALRPMLGLARVGLGGPQLGGLTGGGRQRVSWVHVEDVYRAVRFIEASTLSGPVNVSSPNPVTNRELMGTIRRVLRVPFGVPLQRWMLELGAWAMRTETELVLKSRWVLPRRLLDAGFEFRFPELEGALRDILGRPAR